MEKWKYINGYGKDYKISNKGNVISFKNGTSKKRKICINSCGYKVIALSKNGKRTTHSLHRLLAEHFIDNPNNLPQVNHIDSNRENCSLSNLEWVTVSENIMHGYESGNMKRGEEFYRSQITENEAIEIINAYRLGCFTQKEIGEEYGMAKAGINKLIKGKSWSYLNIQD